MGSNPTESMSAHPRTVPLIRVTAFGCNTQKKPMHRPAQAWMGRVEHTDVPPRCVMISCVRAIQASTGPSTLETIVVSPGTVNIHSRHIRVSIFETVLDCLNHETT